MSRKIISYLSILLFISILVLPTLIWVSHGKKMEESKLDEKRKLNDFPQIRIGFFSEFDLWYNDHTPYRSRIIEEYNAFNQKLSKIYTKSLSPIISTAFAPSWFDKTSGAVYTIPVIENGAIYGLDDWLFYAGDDSIGYYEGTNILTTEEMKALSDKYSSLDDKCREKGIDLIYAVPPNKEQVFPEYMPSYNVVTEYKREEVIEDYIKAAGRVYYIYLLDEMISVKSKYAPYYKEDTHWNSVGAFMGVMAIYKELGYPYLLIYDVDVAITKKTGGDLSSMCGYITEYDDYIVGYKSEITYEVEAYDDVEKFTSTNRNGKTCVIISDSFRVASKGFIAKDYEWTYVCHRANFNEMMVEAVANLKEGDLILIMAVERYDSSNSSVTELVAAALE